MNPDRALVGRFLRSRSEQAFVALYDLHTPIMYRCALRRLGSPDEAESAVQEAWLRALRGLPRFEWRSALRSWLVGITLNCCRETRRRGFRLVAGDEGGGERLADRAAVNRDHPRASRVDGLDLERALAGLPEGAREVLLLHDVEGLTHEEIGTALGIAPGTSKSQLSRARALLRRALAQEAS